ncbi:MAG: glycosyltransferase family 61 protein [Rhodomicrobiaceae bacterium]
MAWPAQKSTWRKRLNARWLRWTVSRWLFQRLPLAKHWSFPLECVAALAAASDIIDDTVRFELAPFEEDDRKLLRLAAINDKVPGPSGLGRSLLFRRQVAIIPHCAALGHVGAVVTSHGGMLLTRHQGEIPNWNRAKPRRLKKVPFGDGLVTWLDGTKHYFHFFEALLPLIDYLENEHTPDRPLTVLIPSDGPPYQDEVCAAVARGYPGVKFVGLRPHERAEIANYLWLSHVSSNAEWLPIEAQKASRLASLVRAHHALDEPRRGGLMFFSRGGAKQRKLLNEAELQSIAAAQGFTQFEADPGDHREQVRRFGEADVIIAVHGAGLTNLLFARPGATVVEIFPENCVKSTYLWLARRLELNYLPLIGRRGNYHQAFTLPRDHFIAALEAALQFRKRDQAPFVTKRAVRSSSADVTMARRSRLIGRASSQR